MAQAALASCFELLETAFYLGTQGGFILPLSGQVGVHGLPDDFGQETPLLRRKANRVGKEFLGGSHDQIVAGRDKVAKRMI